MAKHRSKLIAAIGFLLSSYGLVLSVLLLLWLSTGEALFFVNLFINISPAIFYALPFALFLAVLLKSRRSLLFLLIPSISFLIWYAPRFLPRSIESASGQEIILLTYNMQAKNHNYAELDGILRPANADIVSLQEVNREMGDWLVNEWADEYPYFLRYSSRYYATEYSGRFFMSRFPISDYWFRSVPGDSHLMYMHIDLEIAGKNVQIYNVHLPSPHNSPFFDTHLRTASVTRILNRVNSDSPLIFMGDFNMTEQTNDYRRMSAQYQDSFLSTSSGLGTTWPNLRFDNHSLGFMPALLRIDYIFLSAEFVPQETRVLREGVSDHYPLWARVILKD